VLHPNQVFFYFFEIRVGITNAFKNRAYRALSGQLNGIANMNYSKQKVPNFDAIPS